MQRIKESDNYFTVYPEYKIPKDVTSQKLGTEYTSENTRQFQNYSDIGNLLEQIGEVELYI